ncbi:MAG: hypothetical protein EBZ69_00350 [Alphaproteobacteria bacterium]|nr:hypothetical protein [Alphaproteobacteria bacterium]
MGIDVFLEWEGQEEERAAAKADDKPSWFCTTDGHVGYLREAYHGGPYATKILVREAFESDNCRAEIPAAVMRERLTTITEPVYGADGGHDFAAMFLQMALAARATTDIQRIPSGATQPMSVEDAVRIRHKNLYNSDDEHIEDVIQSFRDFVTLAERKEAELGKPCVVYASY